MYIKTQKVKLFVDNPHINSVTYKSLRAWYNGSTSASQAEDEGSIPFARTKNTTGPCGRVYFWIAATEENPKEPPRGGRVRNVARHRRAQ